MAKASPHSSLVQETQSALPLMFARCSFWSAKPTRQKWVASEQLKVELRVAAWEQGGFRCIHLQSPPGTLRLRSHWLIALPITLNRQSVGLSGSSVSVAPHLLSCKT